MTSTQNSEEQARHLEQVIHNTIPLSKMMGLGVTHLTDNFICLEAPVADANTNIHGTAFAGSIYSMCALSAWGLIHNHLLIDKITANVVIARAEIRYLSPMKEIILCECKVDEQDYSEFHQRLVENGKTSIPLTVRAMEDDNLRAILETRVAVKITES
jgi:thioesterase domain-containing protein